MSKAKELAEKIYIHLLKYPGSSRVEIEMALEITYSEWSDARDELRDRLEFTRTKTKGYVFSVKRELK